MLGLDSVDPHFPDSSFDPGPKAFIIQNGRRFAVGLDMVFQPVCPKLSNGFPLGLSGQAALIVGDKQAEGGFGGFLFFGLAQKVVGLE